MLVHLIGLFVGLVIGSFSVAALMRIRAGFSPNEGRSRCGSCDRELTAIDLVPVLSWVMLRGKCRTCHAPVSGRYAVGELAFGMVGALLATWPMIAILVAIAWVAALALVGEWRVRRGFRRFNA